MSRLMIFVSLFTFQTLFAQQPTDKILELFNIINFNYVDTVITKDLVDGAIVGMLEELDPHSTYIKKDEVEEINEALNGSFEGIGVQFDMFHDTVMVVSPIFGGPSEKLGILSGDKILSADGKLISGVGYSDEQVIATLRGKKGSKVNIQIKRKGVDHPIDYEVTRDNIPIYSVDVSYMISPVIGYMKINRFSKNTMEEFKEALENLKKVGMENLILDLRGNGGGFLHSAVAMADELLDSKDVIVKTEGRMHAPQIYQAQPGGGFTAGKLVILIDEGTASASEIVAGAMQDLDRAFIIGRRSFGKGLVMKPYYFSDGSMIRLTTSRYYTPSGRCIQKDYGESHANYEHEITERFENGELFSMDSVKPPDSLARYTPKGRKVYGGGGIYPDLFVPADTLLAHKTYQQIIRTGAFPEFALEYLEAHREDLLRKYDSEDAFIRDDVLSAALFKEFNQFLMTSKTIEEPLKDHFKKPVSIQLKANLARNLWNDRSYYKVINSDQRVIRKAVEVLSSDQFSWESLSFK